MNIKKENPEVPALETTIKILEYLSRYNHRISTLADISKDLNINKSTCHRILKVLEKHNYVFYHEEKRQYSLGSYLVVLGSRASEFIDYLELSKPYLKCLCNEIKQTIVMLEPASNGKLMYIAKEEPPSPVRVSVSVGQLFPLTSASFGKCYLAFTDETKALEILEKVGLRQFTAKSITNVNDFMNELRKVRTKGYAESYEEHTLGVCGVAAPVFDLDTNVKLIISCLFLSNGPNTDANLYGTKVLETAGKLTMLLGGRFPADFPSP